MGHETWNGKATAFTSGEAEQEAAGRDTQTGTSPHICILLVEDETLIAELIGEALEEHGFSVHAVPDASKALAHLSAGAPVDILFTDINLPGDLDGAALAKRVRELLPDLPVIYASGRWGLLEELRSLPLSITLQKPYSPARACAAVEVLMSKRTAMLESRKALAS